jgi:hypothetical protein
MLQLQPTRLDCSARARDYALVCASHCAWLHWHISSVFFAIPSQCGLQYFEPGGGTQLQAAFPHFF